MREIITVGMPAMQKKELFGNQEQEKPDRQAGS